MGETYFNIRSLSEDPGRTIAAGTLDGKQEGEARLYAA